MSFAQVVIPCPRRTRQSAREIEGSSHAALYKRRSPAQKSDERICWRWELRPSSSSSYKAVPIDRTTERPINPSRNERSLFTVFAGTSHRASPFTPRAFPAVAALFLFPPPRRPPTTIPTESRYRNFVNRSRRIIPHDRFGIPDLQVKDR